MPDLIKWLVISTLVGGGGFGQTSGKFPIFSPAALMQMAAGASGSGGPAYAIGVTSNSILVGKDANGRIVYEYLVPSNGHHAHY